LRGGAAETLLALAAAAGAAAAAVGGGARAEALANLLWGAAVDVACAYGAEVRRVAGLELLWPLATALAKQCVLGGQGLGVLSGDARAGESARSWSRLARFLKVHDCAALNWELTAQTIDTMLGLQPQQQLPPWLLRDVLGEVDADPDTREPPSPRNPPFVCRVLLRHGRVADALDLALAGLERAGLGGARWLSAGLIDQLDAAARAAALADRGASGGALEVKLEQLEAAARTYLLGE